MPSIKIVCPDCKRWWETRPLIHARFADDSGLLVLTQCCEGCLTKRRIALMIVHPVGGQSCTNEDEAKMSRGGGCGHDEEWRRMQSGARNGRMIRKSEPMAG